MATGNIAGWGIKRATREQTQECECDKTVVKRCIGYRDKIGKGKKIGSIGKTDMVLRNR